MRRNSIRLRLLVFALAAVLIGLSVSGVGLVALFGRHVERRVGAELDSYLTQIAGNLRLDDADTLFVSRLPGDPRFSRILGGLYWQVKDEQTGALLRSRSLWDSALDLPADEPSPGQIHEHRADGPGGQHLLMHEQRVILEHNGVDRPVRIAAAVNMADVDALKAGFARDLVPGLGLLGIVMLAGLWFQVSAGLRPVEAMRRGILAIRSGRLERLPLDNAPDEIAPLAGEVNALLDAQDAAMVRSRDRAADMAHGLKTPLAALTSDVARIRAAGLEDVAGDVERVAFQMRRTIEHELARSRLRHQRGAPRAQDLREAADAIIRTLGRTPAGETVAIRNEIAAGLAVLCDRDDLNDLLGNLLENAVKFARSAVSVSAMREAAAIRITIEDDGADPDPSAMQRLAARGVRMDETGTGLGLAISTDILSEYGSAAAFDRSPLGGLAVSFDLPAG